MVGDICCLVRHVDANDWLHVFVLLMRCRKNEAEQIQVNVEFPGLTVVSSNNGGRTWTVHPLGASRRNTTLMLATRFV